MSLTGPGDETGVTMVSQGLSWTLMDWGGGVALLHYAVSAAECYRWHHDGVTGCNGTTSAASWFLSKHEDQCGIYVIYKYSQLEHSSYFRKV